MNDEDNTITIDTIDISSMASSNYVFSSPSNQIYSIATASGSGGIGATGSIGSSWITNSTAWPSNITNGNAGLHVTSDAAFDGDIKWKGRSLGKLLQGIEDRLAIIQDPSPEKLEKFAALKKAYDNYKMLERLIGDDSNDSDKN
jgi:hypothetical protein